MSHLIPAGSTKTDRAIRFGRELERAMKARGVGSRTIAEPMGSSRTSVMYWRTGRMLPRAETARKLAQVLAWPGLETLAVRLRSKDCLTCRSSFVDDSGSDNRLYCSASCQRVAEKKRVGVSREHRAAIAEHRVTILERAIAGFCRGCEPEGYCYEAGCELRPVSPLPLNTDRSELDGARAKPHNGYRAPGADSARMRATWARYSPEEAAARKARAAQASRIARGLVPAEAAS